MMIHQKRFSSNFMQDSGIKHNTISEIRKISSLEPSQLLDLCNKKCKGIDKLQLDKELI